MPQDDILAAASEVDEPTNEDRMNSMQIGVVFSQADSGSEPDAIRRWVLDAEDAGFEHLLAYDHVVGVTRDRFKQSSFGGFPEPVYTIEHLFHEILVMFSHFAAITERMEFITSVLVAPQRQTVLMAKQIATLDLLSGGRICPALGVGWNAVEYEVLGGDFASRTRFMSEQIDVLRALWSEPVVNFTGEFHDLQGVGLNPLPTRDIPIYVGSRASEPALQRVAAKADGWLPLVIPGVDPVGIADAVKRLREICDDIGRDPSTMAISGRVALGDGWQQSVEEAMELGFEKLSFGFNRMANPGFTHAEHLASLLDAKPELDAIIG